MCVENGDVEWQALRKRIRKRDGNTCRLLRILSPTEKSDFLERHQKTRLQCAHVLPASERKDLIYADDNVLLLNEFSHRSLDESRDPITGAAIDQEQVRAWWMRLLGDKQLARLKQANQGKSPWP